MIRVVWQMVRLNLLGFWRDKRALVALFGMPLLITVILSLALGDFFGTGVVPRFTVAVYNADQGSYGNQLTSFLVGQKSQLDVVRAASVADARALTAQDRVAVVVAIPQNTSVQLELDRRARVDVEAPLNHVTDESVVQAMIDAYGAQFAELKYLALQTKAGTAPLVPANVRFAAVESGMHPVTAAAYYAIGMMVMYLMVNAINRSAAMVRDRNSDCYRRMTASPSSRYVIAAGHWLTDFVVLFLQGSVLLVGSKWLLGIQYGPTMQVVLLLAAYAAALAGIAVLLGSFVTSEHALSAVGNIGVQVAAVLGGSMIPVFAFPPLVQSIARLIPNGLTLSTLVDTVIGVSTSSLATSALYLVVLGLVLGVIAGWRYGQPA